MTAAYARTVRHSTEQGTICWLDGAAAVNPPAAKGAAAVPVVELTQVEQDALVVLAYIPPTARIEKKQIIDDPGLRAVMGRDRIPKALKHMEGRSVREVQVPRAKKTPAVYIERVVVEADPNGPGDDPEP